MGGRISLIETQAQLLRQVKEEVQYRLGTQSPAIANYYLQYRAEFQGRWQSCSMRYLLDEIGKHQVVLGGDFHAFGQSQRSHLRLLRTLPQGKPVVLGLECIETRYQKWLDLYLLGQIGEQDFLNEVKWDKHWGFPWRNYRPLVQIAAERGYPVVALNRYFSKKSEEQLKKRDQFTANQIVKTISKYSDHLLYVVFGDLHLAASHLPAALAEKNAHIKVLKLFQSSEKLYFDLRRKNREQDVEILKAKGGRFCLMWSPPWVKWQSYLMHLESAGEEELEEEVDFTDYVSSLVNYVGQELGLRINTNNLAISGLNKTWIYNRLNEKFSSNDFSMARYLIERDRSFYCPGLGIGYMSRSSVNHAAALAGEYIQSQIGKRAAMAWTFPGHLEALIWSEAMGFFLSKIINHRRKPEFKMELDLIGQGKSKPLDQMDRGEAWALAMDIKMSELIWLSQGRKREFKYRPKRKTSYLGAARYLGQSLGDSLYRVYREGRLAMPKIRQILQKDVFGDGFSEEYQKLIRLIHSENKSRPVRNHI